MSGQHGGHFQDDRHALYAGWLIGLGMKHGLPIRPVADDDGNYTDHLVVDLRDDGTIELVVPYPPADWTPA